MELWDQPLTSMNSTPKGLRMMYVTHVETLCMYSRFYYIIIKNMKVKFCSLKSRWKMVSNEFFFTVKACSFIKLLLLRYLTNVSSESC